MTSSKRAFTLLELLVVIAVIAMLAAMLLPALAATQGKTNEITCLNNLKQIGLAFRIWEGDNNDRYPMAVSMSAGGANEYLAHSSIGATPNNATKALFPGMAFMVMSNELSTPKVLYCPSDNIHTNGNGYATNFTYGNLLAFPIDNPPTTGLTGAQTGEPAGANDSKISYFINGDASSASPQDIFSGDDNIGNNQATTASTVADYRFGGNSTAETCTYAENGVTSQGLVYQAFNGIPFWSWTANDFHQKSGNLLMTDGNVQSATISGLHSYLNHSTNSAPAEAFNFMP